MLAIAEKEYIVAFPVPMSENNQRNSERPKAKNSKRTTPARKEGLPHPYPGTLCCKLTERSGRSPDSICCKTRTGCWILLLMTRRIQIYTLTVKIYGVPNEDIKTHLRKLRGRIQTNLWWGKRTGYSYILPILQWVHNSREWKVRWVGPMMSSQ